MSPMIYYVLGYSPQGNTISQISPSLTTFSIPQHLSQASASNPSKKHSLELKHVSSENQQEFFNKFVMNMASVMGRSPRTDYSYSSSHSPRAQSSHAQNRVNTLLLQQLTGRPQSPQSPYRRPTLGMYVCV